MKFYHILIAVAILNISGLWLMDSIQERKQTEFKLYGQFEPEMMLLEHDGMMLLCDQYDLIYDFETGECI